MGAHTVRVSDAEPPFSVCVADQVVVANVGTVAEALNARRRLSMKHRHFDVSIRDASGAIVVGAPD